MSAWRILVVDDDPLVCDSMRRMLAVDGHQVALAGSANEALTLCDKEAFDLIIIDYLMPVMKGDKLALAIKERFPHKPIIMITADAEKLESLKENPAGVDLVIGKPFRLDDLRQAVSRVLVKS
jgi:CheY-like chemotaxis protein